MAAGFCSFTDYDNAVFVIYIIMFALGVVLGVFGAILAYKYALHSEKTVDAFPVLMLGALSLIGIVFWPIGIVCGIIALTWYR